MVATVESFIGRGIVYIGPADGSGPMVDRGNVQLAQVAYTADSKKQPNFRIGGGGNYASVDTVTGVGLALKFSDYSAANLVIAQFGDSTVIASGAVLAEVQTAYIGGLVAFDNLPDTSVPYVVKDVTDVTTYVKDTDYTEVKGGILIIAGGAISDADVLHIDYTKKGSTVIQALTQSAKEYHVQIDGLNDAKGGAAVFNDFFKVKFGPAGSLDWIGADFAEIDLVGEVLADTTKGSGLSQYYKTKLT